MRRSAALCIILLVLSGCETTVASVALAVVGANVTSLTYTDKTLIDFAIAEILDVIIGRPQAMASKIGKPNPS